MNSNRHQTTGKYAPKKKGGKFKVFLFLLLIGAGFYGYHALSKSIVVTNTTQPVVKVDPNQSAIDKIKERENFKKRIENQAKQVYLQEQIDDRQAKIEALKKEQADLETQLEITRQEELGL